MGPTGETFRAWEDKELTRIRELVPQGWHIWYVSHGMPLHVTWHATPPGGVRSCVTADKPADLLVAIERPGTWVADEIEKTRKERDAMRPGWCREREHLSQQLDALERLVV